MRKRLCYAALIVLLLVGAWVFGTYRANRRWTDLYGLRGFVSYDRNWNNDFVRQNVAIEAKYVSANDLRLLDQVCGWPAVGSNASARDIYLVTRCRQKGSCRAVISTLQAKLVLPGGASDKVMDLVGEYRFNLGDTAYFVNRVVGYDQDRRYGTCSNLLQTTPSFDFVAVSGK